MDFQLIQPILPLWTDASSSGAPGVGEASSVPFSDIFQSAVDAVRETSANFAEKEYQLATGQLDNPAEVTIAATQAQMSVELLVQLRNKALDAYNGLMQINM